MLIPRQSRLLLFFAATILLSACHSKKLTVRNNADLAPNGIPVRRGPYVMVKPDKEIAEKYSALMGIKRNEIQNGRLYSFIDEWYGTPYRFGGMDKDGVDCSGLVFLLQLQVYDQPLPRTCAQQVNVVKRKYEEKLKEGDLVFFDFDGKQYSHVGVYLQNGYFVHASTRKGVMVARLHDNGIYKFFSRGGSISETTSAQVD
ncbi:MULTISPECIES: C40 family peptidase [unclassified Mucilaginibacter]|uniref:C40 family peptidase n=1 Tax=unclassified Mucilaginibacter TaxID=2617802 RepID=UPI002AC9C597|nr:MULTISPECIES: C40 family peptidase [unclassified Mucilaginibacter]MEB0262990.1 C40 family peptidase [Mucilaginibacter sp. 10I4]MEB0280294.1 C40 family peptidase [Mucilaginibacter sp. 10B2]MEB0300239.1 C40 family peptidase [Mucilaginibacter sp. 5C4]WPX25596.1 C40 family peptidase [Mucilaginibacter sp. 5C4]